MDPTDIDGRAPQWVDVDSLLGAHLHQHIDEVYGGPWEAVRAFSDDSSREQRAGAVDGLRRLLGLFADDEGLAEAAHRLGMDYHPPADGLSYREWLTAVADVLENPRGQGDVEPGR